MSSFRTKPYVGEAIAAQDGQRGRIVFAVHCERSARVEDLVLLDKLALPTARCPGATRRPRSQGRRPAARRS
eukprot:6194604-Prymnesium_polylepis.1